MYSGHANQAVSSGETSLIKERGGQPFHTLVTRNRKTVMRIATFTFAAMTLLFSMVATADVELQPGEYVVFYHHDVLGSPVTATNEQGQVIWHERHSPYGKSEGRVSQNGYAFGDNALPAGNARQGYTGHTLDSSAGLTYMKARYYDHHIGRFLSNDPIGFNSANPETFGRYTYTGNNPYGFTDPSGKSKASLWQKVVDAGLDSQVRIINKDLAGKTHPTTNIPFDKNGFPDFSSVAEETVKGLKWTGTRSKDVKLANKAIGIDKTPEGMVWEHAVSGEMHLVPKSIHSQTGHTGGFKLHAVLIAAGTVGSTVANAAVEDPFSFALDIIDPGFMGTLGNGELDGGPRTTSDLYGPNGEY